MALPLIAWLDWRTGDRVGLMVFYVLPVGWAAYRVGRGFAFGIALASAALCLTVDRWTSLHAVDARFVVWRTLDRGLIYLIVALTVARLRRQHDQLLAAARTDPLTSLLNRRAFDELAIRESRRARREASPVALAVVDIDHFKLVNDTLGHAGGDEVLRKVAEILAAGRETDVVARVGGDEFAMFLPDCSAEAAAVVLERVRVAVAQVAAANGWPVTLSIGIAGCDDGRAALRELETVADASLYEVKRAGRDAVRVTRVVAGIGGSEQRCVVDPGTRSA